MAADPAKKRAGRQLVLAGSLLVLVLATSAAGAYLLRQNLFSPNPSATTSSHDNAALKKGRMLYLVSCAHCHGPEGRGDGLSAATLNPPPRDFAESQWKHGTAPESVRRVIRNGLPGTSMPGSPSLSENDLDALTTFVLTMAPRTETVERLSPQLVEQLRAAGFSPVDPPRVASPLSLQDLDGRAVSLNQFLGRAVLVNFWGTECVHCLKQLPDLERLAETLAPNEGGPGLIVLPICLDENDRELVRHVARQHVQRLPVFVDRSGLGKLRYDAQVMPSTYLIDARGRLVGTAQGRHEWSVKKLKDIIEGH